ncbi:MAG TPA: DUF1254 domain-containing protein [Amaricoccus sp.]|uniref:DUF1254 domain-containing protein n=1 Tax=Amaricoccus sp. TaxID=1872485 RepID=UPI002BB17B21|nr:DUF1254 domain-containing protein [Amaricoccus sp.]HMQ93228.1 DUF1254 domain-containing protein [Amaricoccus sp.]HMR54259.1 DUF1254 domain-containing protein [Amaricoccus sp.]HMR61630.1 DUF1254 domain-containing protein [Amaricoccus sp.]HMU01237.1 DUF1254 domain-containing protein [Amaricoccus sp.]
MTLLDRRLCCGTALALLLSGTASAQVSEEALQSISTPASVETRIGTLDFPNGTPSDDTATAVYDHLDFTYAFRAFTDTYKGVSMQALLEGFEAAGVKDNELLLFSELMDSSSLFLTANADTVYYLGFVDLSDGPMVVETPPEALGTFDDMWFRWVIDFGRPGPDRGEGGKYLLVGPGYDGPLPEDGFYVGHSKTNRVIMLGRSFLKDNDPTEPVETIKSTTKIYPYVEGGVGTSIAEFLEGGIKLAQDATPQTPVFHEGTGLAMNTVPPNDYSYYDMLNRLVQSEPATTLDPELMGPIAAIGIIKGQDFAPDDRMKGILTDAVALANATGRTLGFDPRDEDWYYYEDSQWYIPLFTGGYLFETPIPEITADGAKPFPPTGYRKNDARTSFFYMATGITPAMAMRLTHVGSQYLETAKDANGDWLDGAKTYNVTLPKDIPAAAFWSFTLYDNQTRSMLVTPQKYPRAGSQSYPSPAAEAAEDGRTTVWFSPEQPDGVGRGNWIQTDPEKGYFVVLRLYSPLASYFDKSWRPSEIEAVQ